jgi:hypothetical protein
LSIVESKLGDSGRSLFGDDFQAFHDTGDDFVLDARVETLGVFANDYQIDVFIARFHTGKVFDRPEISVEIETLAQLDVDAGKAFAHRRRHWPFESDFVLGKRIHHLFRQRGAVFFQCLRAGQMRVPFDVHPGGFDQFQSGFHHLGPNPIARYQCDLVSFHSHFRSAS